ncbi:Caspase-like domain, partial [Trinorchestia longiramus]
TDPLKDLGVKEIDAPKILFLSCKPVHGKHVEIASSCSMCRLIDKFKEALQTETMQPLMRELKVKTIRVSELDVPFLETSTLVSNFSELEDSISESDEELLTFTEVLTVVGYTVPELLQSKLQAVLANKRIPAKHMRTNTENANHFLAYTLNKKLKEICDSLSSEEVYALKTFITEQSKTETALDELAEGISVIKSVASLNKSPAMKDTAFYYMMIYMFKQGNLNALYTHQLEYYLEGAKLLLPNPESREHIPKAVTQLKRYQLNKKPPGVCLILAMDDDREGNMEDVGAVKKLFEAELNYDVFHKINPTVRDVKNLITKLGESRNAFYDSLVVWFMAHGDKSYLTVKDGEIHRREDLIQPFVDIEWLKTKPKLFFIQACANKRGRSMVESKGLRISKDAMALGIEAGEDWMKKYAAHSDYSSVNNFADTLVCYATMWYQPAARNDEGSIFIHTLLDVLRRKGTEVSIENVLRETTYKMNSILLQDEDNKSWRQTPYYESSLQKQFVFPE